MGHKAKIQKITRPKSNTYNVNIPTAIVEAMAIEKGEVFVWYLEDRNTLILRRANPLESFIKKEKSE